MKPKEIHDLLLSLFIRGLGIWVLYTAVDNVFTLLNLVEEYLFPLYFSVHPGSKEVFDVLVFFAAKILMAAYLILGAPPFLKWATRNRD